MKCDNLWFLYHLQDDFHLGHFATVSVDYTGCSRRVGQYCGRSQNKYVRPIERFHCTDEQQAMSPHKLRNALMLAVEFSKIR